MATEAGSGTEAGAGGIDSVLESENELTPPIVLSVKLTVKLAGVDVEPPPKFVPPVNEPRT